MDVKDDTVIPRRHSGLSGCAVVTTTTNCGTLRIILRTSLCVVSTPFDISGLLEYDLEIVFECCDDWWLMLVCIWVVEGYCLRIATMGWGYCEFTNLNWGNKRWHWRQRSCNRFRYIALCNCGHCLDGCTNVLNVSQESPCHYCPALWAFHNIVFQLFGGWGKSKSHRPMKGMHCNAVSLRVAFIWMLKIKRPLRGNTSTVIFATSTPGNSSRLCPNFSVTSLVESSTVDEPCPSYAELRYMVSPSH